jgi:LmbE family N-acetylglucosaminyl deacetylase
MRFSNPISITLCLLHAFAGLVYAQEAFSGAAEIHQSLHRLNTTGSVLMIAAHPDDENTNLLAYFARGRHLRTGYLSLTRGEGGQNLIGPEQGDLMGVIRTQELLAARRIDGAEQFFTRAIDFGFSKTAEETLAKWGREEILGDIVWVIRKFRPDVIILRFSGTPRDGHGHHQSSAMLAKEAFFAAADPARYPEQLHAVKPWRAKRVLYNQFAFTAEQEKENAKVASLAVDSGGFDPMLGYSYGEIAGMSRSRHASQGFGSAERRGAIRNHLVVIAGEPAMKDPFEGVDTSWHRLPGGGPVATLLDAAVKAFRPTTPEATAVLLLKARPLIALINHPDAERKLAELDETVARCVGLWMDASASNPTAVPGSAARIELSVVNRLGSSVTFLGAQLEGMAGLPSWTMEETSLPFNEPMQQGLEWKIPAEAAYTQPFWLAHPKKGGLYGVENIDWVGRPDHPPPVTARFRFQLEGTGFEVVRPVHHRYVDNVRGELTRPFVLTPPVSVQFNASTILFASREPRQVTLTVRANQAKAAGLVRLKAPAGWRMEPGEAPFSFERMGEEKAVVFTIHPPQEDATATLEAVAETAGRQSNVSMHVIAYPHIPPQTVFVPATAKLVRREIRTLSHNAGYIMGAGDELPAALGELGVAVTLLSDDDLVRADLGRFDVIVTGVRCFNTRPVLRANFQRLLDYVQSGGALVVQYNVLEGFPGRERRDTLSRIGPYPITISRARVTVEDAPVQFSRPDHPLLMAPNRITEKDFEGWVQERGLYFASQFDSRYESLFSSRDPGEDWLPGGMLFARYGKGAYVFTAYSWFRQLPAGVPGAFRIFANLLSAGKP